VAPRHSVDHFSVYQTQMLTTIPGEVLTIPGSSMNEGRVGERAKRKRLMVVNHVSCRASRNDDSAGVARLGHTQPPRHTGGRTHTHSMLGGRQHGLTPVSWKPEKPLNKIDHVRRSICFCLDGHRWTTTCHLTFPLSKPIRCDENEKGNPKDVLPLNADCSHLGSMFCRS